MADSRESTAAVTAPRLAFEVERFEWTADDRLELTGRWFGLRGQRFLRPTLEIEVGGRHHRLLALMEHKPWAADNGRHWVAAFGWQDEPVHVTAAELAVGPDLTVDLPRPEGGSAAPPAPAGDADSPERHEARRPRAQVENELAVERGETERLAGELEQARAAHAARVEELEQQLGAERETLAALGRDLDAAREKLADAQASGATRLRQLGNERDAALATSAAALAETKKIESERDAALRARSAVEQEREAAVHARDSARQERNAWMSRARASLAEKTADAARPAARPSHPTAPQPEAARPRMVEARPEPSAPAATRRSKGRTVPGDGRPRPGVRTVRIGANDSVRPPPGVGMDAPDQLRVGRQPSLSAWAIPLVAALALLAGAALLILVVV